MIRSVVPSASPHVKLIPLVDDFRVRRDARIREDGAPDDQPDTAAGGLRVVSNWRCAGIVAAAIIGGVAIGVLIGVLANGVWPP